jgi:hypothetical protein
LYRDLSTSPIFSSRPISKWILDVIYFSNRLEILTTDSHKFQLFATLVVDFIWQFKNKLIRDGILPNPIQAIHHLKVTLQSATLPSFWLPPIFGCFKSNFDVAIRDNFFVAVAGIRNFFRKIILAVTQKLYVSNVLIGEVSTTLLVTRLAASTGIGDFMLEGDALLVIVAVNQPHLFSS